MLPNFIITAMISGEHVIILFSLNNTLISLKFNLLLNLPCKISVFFKCIAQIHFHLLGSILSTKANFKRYPLTPSRYGCESYGMTYTELYLCPRDVSVRNSWLYFWEWTVFDEC